MGFPLLLEYNYAIRMAGFLYKFKYTKARFLGPHQQDLPVSSNLARLTGDEELEIPKNDLTRTRNN